MHFTQEIARCFYTGNRVISNTMYAERAAEYHIPRLVERGMAGKMDMAFRNAVKA